MFLLLAACPACTTYYYVVRHAEKADNSTNPPLSLAGQQRARDLRDSLASKGIDSIFTSTFIRTRQTAAPLATLLNKTIRVHSGTSDQLVADLKAIKNKAVLVVGHSNTVPVIVNGLSGQTIPVIDENDFDNMYIIKIKKGLGTKRSLRHITYGALSPAP